MDAEEGLGMAAPTGHTPFVGREHELRLLRHAFDEAAAGRGALVMVVGEPGIGKTTLCEHLAAYAAGRDGQVLIGHCYEEGSLSLPYLPFVEALRAYTLAHEPAALREELGDGAADVARIVPELRGRLDIARAAGGDPEYDRYRLLQSVTTFLGAIAATQPLLLMIEDLHDADRGTLDLLIHLARSLRDIRLLVVGTYRDVEVDRAHPLSGALAALRRAAPFDRVALRGLDAGDVQQMMERFTGRELSRNLAGAVHHQTEGNPLFVQEVLRYLLDEGSIGQAGEADVAAAGIPEGLRDVIGRRLSRLSPDCNRVLAVAAVIGREFDLAILEAVAGVEEDTLLSALDEAVHAAVIEEQERLGVVRYHFSHAFFRQTLYEELIAPRRLRLHQQVARAIEALHARRLEDHAAELAEHFSHSTDPADLEKAVAYYDRAAEQASSVYAYGEAVRLLEQALQVQEVLDPTDAARRCDLLLAIGEALLPAGDPERAARQVAPAAFALAEALGDRGRAARVSLKALEAMAMLGGADLWHTPEYQRWAARADAAASGDGPERVRADVFLADVLIASGKLDAAWTISMRAVELARGLRQPELFFAAANNLFTAPWPPDAYLTLIDVAGELAAWPSDGVRPRILARAWQSIALVALQQGDRDRAEHVWANIAHLIERTGDAFSRSLPMGSRLRRAAMDGRLQDAEAIADALASRGGGPSPTGIRFLFAQQSGLEARLLLGHFEQALESLGTGGETAAWWFEPRRIMCLAEMGRTDEARPLLLQTVRRLQAEGGTHGTSAAALLSYLRAAVRLHEREAVALIAPALQPLAALVGLHHELTPIARHLGAAAALLGDRPAAVAYTEQALAVSERMRYRPEVALARLQLAELLHDGSAEQRHQARAHLEFAGVEFEAMGMLPALERARRLQERLGGPRTSRPASQHPDGLSDREVEVLRGIAAGRSNQQIADALIVSVRTVERHAVNIYAKIGARGRTDAVAYAVRHGLVDATRA
jgi:DNA-binding CsgD family transcriptional regulator/tetratricopeptide (TPR) repeat protein